MQVIKSMEQGSEEWLQSRMGKITGTKVKNIMGTKTSYWNQVAEFIAEEGTGRSKTFKTTEEMDRGNTEEKYALEAFTERTGKNVETVSMCISDENPIWTYSPDGLTNDDYSEGVEIKSLDSKNHVMNMIKNNFSDISDSLPKGQRNIMGIPSEHVWQVVHSFLVNEKQELLYFLFWDSRFISEEWQLNIVEITRDDEELQNLLIREREGLKMFESDVNRVRPIILKSSF